MYDLSSKVLAEQAKLQEGLAKSMTFEGIQSANLAQLVNSVGDPQLLKKLYALTNIAIDKLEDNRVRVFDLEAHRKANPDAEYWKTASAMRAAEIDPDRGLCFWVVTADKKSGKQSLPKGLIAVTLDGKAIYEKEGQWSLYKSDAGDSKTLAPKGHSKVEKLREVSDIVYFIYLEGSRRTGLNTDDLQATRKSARSGATALISNEKFKEWNQSRYATILASQKVEPRLTAIAEELRTLGADLMSKVDLGKFKHMPYSGGSPVVPGLETKRGGVVPVDKFFAFLEKAWEKVNDAQSTQAELTSTAKYAKDHHQDAYDKAYYAKQIAKEEEKYTEKLAELTKILAELKSGKLESLWY